MPSGNQPPEPPRSQPLLTIGIPTYNRRGFVEKLLVSIENEFREMDPAMVSQIEVLVSNNCSSDDTAALLESMKGRMPNLRVNTQPRNLGPYENIITCIEMGRGEWTWPHGDDDVTIPGGLASLMRILGSDQADFVVLYDSRFNRPFKGDFEGTVKEFVAFCAKTEPFLLLEHSLITSNVFRKKLFNPEDMRRWVKTDYGHLYAIMRGCLPINARVSVPEFDVFHIPEDRPPFECWPDNIDKSWRDYLLWLGEQTGVQINVDRAMDHTRSRLKNELRNPFRFVLKNRRNIFRFGAYPFLMKRLFTLFLKKR